MARKFLRSFPDDGHIVTPSGSCAAMVKHGYPVLFRDEPRMLARARSVGERIYELSQFLVDVLGVTDPKSDFSGKGDVPRLVPPAAGAGGDRGPAEAAARRPRSRVRRDGGERPVLRLRGRLLPQVPADLLQDDGAQGRADPRDRRVVRHLRGPRVPAEHRRVDLADRVPGEDDPSRRNPRGETGGVLLRADAASEDTRPRATEERAAADGAQRQRVRAKRQEGAPRQDAAGSARADHGAVPGPPRRGGRRLPGVRGDPRARVADQGGRPRPSGHVPRALHRGGGKTGRDRPCGPGRGPGAGDRGADRAGRGDHPRREVEVDGVRGGLLQRGAAGSGRHGRRVRPRGVHHPARGGGAFPHHRPRRPQDARRDLPPLRAPPRGAADRQHPRAGRDGPQAPAGEVPLRGNGRLRRELPRGRHRLRRARHQRGERADGDDPAARPPRRRRDREGHPAHGGPADLPSPPAAQRLRPGDLVVRVDRDGDEARGRPRGAGADAYPPARLRPQRDPRGKVPGESSNASAAPRA